MNTNKLLLIISLLFFTFNSCEKLEFGNEFLEKEPSGGDTTIEVIFGSLVNANRYLTTAYATLPYGIPTTQGGRFGFTVDILECLTDLSNSYLSWGGANTFYYNGQYSAGVESDNTTSTKYNYTGEQNWVGIRVALNFINNVDKVPDATEIQKKRLIAEARMIIAVHYCDMYRHFGGLPWVDKLYTSSDAPILPRLTSLETLNKIVELIDSTVADLPLTIANPAQDDGRFTKAAALGLKARILLFGASPLFNNANAYYTLNNPKAVQDKLVWHGGYDRELWKKAADAAKAVLDLGAYQLVNTGNFRKDFRDAYYNRNNGEVLISTRVRNLGLDFWNANYYFYQAVSEYGVANPTKNYVDMFPTDDGVPVYKEDGSINTNNTRYDPTLPWANRDPRLYETVLVNGDQFKNRTVELYPGGQEVIYGRPNLRTGFKIRKFIWDTDRFSSTVRNTVIHWPYLRLAEIYYTYAEALNEYNNEPTQEAIDAVNAVRSRVGLGNLTSEQIANKESFRKAILTERACEFGFEDVRWFDIVRHKMASAFTKKLEGHIIATANAAKTSFTYQTTEVTPARSWSKEVNGNLGPNDVHNFRWYLSAFPVNEVNKNYGLVQNPGW